MNGFLAIVLWIAASGTVTMAPPVHFETHHQCREYARAASWAIREGVALRNWRCISAMSIRYGGEALLDSGEFAKPANARQMPGE